VGDPRRQVGILNNPAYRGEVVWKRSRWTPSAKNSAIRRVEAVAESEWIKRTDESLRIITDELWNRVHAIQTGSNPRREAVRLGVANRSFRFRSRYLLGGTLVCGVCGSNYIGDGRTDYLCPTHTTGHCDNPMRFRREDIHQAVFDLLTEHLFE